VPSAGGQGRAGREKEREGEGGVGQLTTSTMNGVNHNSLVIQTRAGREWERRKRERGGFSSPKSWVCGRARGRAVGRASGEGAVAPRRAGGRAGGCAEPRAGPLLLFFL
jgi:hypothetical protein